jgi:ATP-binding cassette subfamily B protein
MPAHKNSRRAEVKPEIQSEAKLTRQTLLFYWQCFRKYPRYVVGLIISLPITILTNSFLPPLILAKVLNRLSKHQYQQHHIWASFGPELITYAVLVIASGVVAWRVVDALDWRLEAKVERDIARRVFDHLMKQSAHFHSNTFGGSLVSQTTKLMGSYIRFADTMIFQIFPLLLSLVFASIILSSRAPLFVAVLVAFSVIYIITAFYVTKRVRKLGAAHSAAESAQTGYLADMITNVMAVKSFTGSRIESQSFRKITGRTSNRLTAMMRGNQRQQIYFSSMTGIISGLSLTMAVISVMVFNADLATVFLILNYTSSIISQLFTFSNSTLRTLNRAFGDARDMIGILNMTAEIQDPDLPETVRIGRGAITFKNVTFRHDGSDDAIFEHLDLNIKPGEKVGLVGHSGSGKTTLTRLLLRFSDIQSGAIEIDGQNITAITQDDLRRHIAYVPQEPLLFHRSVSENIGYGQPHIDQQAVMAVAKLAHADEFITSLPQGYDTLVGERGVKLSGGQRQRVAIARAMLKNAPILALDEATSALDSESEVLIQDALWKLMEGRSAIVIAHRLSTIQHMDRIIVLSDGKIVEQGSHKELIHGGGTYATLWAHQSGGFMED